ncbi:MAG: hypothetical protein AAFP98_05395 [Pseudomonadota bacterium]
MTAHARQSGIGTLTHVMPSWLTRMHGGPREVFEKSFDVMAEAVAVARRDRLEQLIPIILAERKSVPELRKTLGKATWRRIHHADTGTNLLRALVWLRHQQEAIWSDIAMVPDHHLRSCRNVIDWETGQFAATHAPEGEFQKYAMLYRDVIKLGVRPRPQWSPARVRRERDRRFSQSKIKQASAVSWAPSFICQIGDFRFSRLCDDRALVTEGIAMRHCVASYRDDARTGSAVVMRCEGAERATLRFSSVESFELRGFANADVSESCVAASLIARKVFLANA